MWWENNWYPLEGQIFSITIKTLPFDLGIPYLGIHIYFPTKTYEKNVHYDIVGRVKKKWYIFSVILLNIK